MKTLLLAIALFAGNAAFANQACKIQIKIYEETSLDAALQIKSGLVAKTNFKGIPVYNLTECRTKYHDRHPEKPNATFDYWFPTADVDEVCPDVPYVHSQPTIIFGKSTSQACLNLVAVTAVQQGIDNKKLIIKKNLSDSSKTIDLILPPYTELN